MPDLIAGRVSMYVSPTIGVLPQHIDKQLKILATTSPQRLKGMADVPTLKENGLDYVRYGFLGICAAKGTPQPILDLLNRHIVVDRGDAGLPRPDREGRLVCRNPRRRKAWGKSSHRRWTTLRLQSANSECSRNRLWHGTGLGQSGRTGRTI